MMFLKTVFCSFIILLLHTPSFGQKSKQYGPYSIETTYTKLKEKYPFVTPITASPLLLNRIKSKTNVAYKKASGEKLKLDIYYPKYCSKKTFPAVLLIHGGGWLTGSKENQKIMAQHLAVNGYVAITVAYRLGTIAPYPAAVKDLKDAIIWMRKNAQKHHINPNKIAVLGTSAGAQLATLVGTTPNLDIYQDNDTVSTAVQAIINIDGIVSFVHPEAAAEGTMAGIWLNGTRITNAKNWKEASPLEHVNKNTPPTLFINSSLARFHAGRDDMLNILNKHNIYNKTHTLKDSPHSFWLLNPWFTPTLEHTLTFLKNTLK